MADVSMLEDHKDHSAIKEELKRYIAKDDHVFIVLDDDPTGTQTVHDINVYTDRSYETLKEAMLNNKLFFLLTNSRALTASQSRRLHEEIVNNVQKVYEETGRKYLYISRGDSTLRGHYPMETQILSEGLLKEYGKVDGEILFPFFKEGGRYTIDDVHYVRYGNELVPAGETEFAKDKTFGYHSSDLKEYIEEKSEGKVRKEDVISISLKDLRDEKIEEITSQLLNAHDYARIIVNGACDSDVRTFCLALYKAMEKGKVFVFRSAASFVKGVGGIEDIPLLERTDMIRKETENGGLIVVGSHTDKTTRQLNELLTIEGIRKEEFHCSKILESEEAFKEEIDRCRNVIEETIAKGSTIVVYTERVLIDLKGDDKETALKRSVAISDGLCEITGGLRIEPSFVIAKGGITSSDTATKALKIAKAKVLGQIQPGVPVWKADEDSKIPGIPYVIFPGNVGNDDTLKNAVLKLL